MPATIAQQNSLQHMRRAARGWYVATLIGQLLFIAFIVAFYYVRVISGDLAGFNDKPLITGHVAGDAVGNRMFSVHVLLAAAMTLAGLMQLVPAIRSRWPRLHRWSGRAFLLSAAALALGGLWLTWGRGSYLNVIGAVAITMDAALILGFGTLAFATARARDFAAHRRWALRTFMVASGVWFMRVGYIGWGLATGGIGIGKAMNGPFDLFWAFATHLLPLAVLELYLRAERGPPGGQRAMAAGLWLASATILAGSIGAWFVMWMPHI